MPLPYEFIDHTADYAMQAWGCDFGDLLQNAGRGMIRLMADVEGVEPRETVTVSARGGSREQVLVRALKQLLLLHEDGWQPVSARTITWATGAADLAVGIVKLDDVAHLIEAHLKAVTYHGIEIAGDETGICVQVVFDT